MPNVGKCTYKGAQDKKYRCAFKIDEILKLVPKIGLEHQSNLSGESLESLRPGMDILRIYRIERQDLAFESNRASVDSNRIERSSCRFASNRTWQNCWPFDSSRIERESSIFASNRTRKISCLFDSTRIERVSCRFDVYRMPSFDRIRIVFDRT